MSSLNISGSSAFLSLVEEEAIAFGDLVFFANLTEEYSNLPQKVEKRTYHLSLSTSQKKGKEKNSKKKEVKNKVKEKGI